MVHALLEWYGADIAARTTSDIDDRLTPIFRRIADVIEYAIAFMVMLSCLNIDISPILAGLGIGGLVVALALQSTLSYVLAGTYGITDLAIRIGYFIMLDNGTEGNVEEIGCLTTKIRTWEGNLVVLLNSRLSGAIVTYFEKLYIFVAFSIDCGVSYHSDLQKVE